MDGFKKYHPIVNFVYFVFVIGFTMFIMHPIALVISLVGGFIYSVRLKGRRAVRNNLLYMIPMLFLTALINPAFNHEGMTVLAYFPNGNPLTAESVFYGISAAIMLISVICWFSCFNEIMTSDKTVYLFGRLTPSLSLMISMALRLVPKFKKQFKVVSDAQCCLGKGIKEGNIVKRAKNGVSIVSIMLTWSLENAVETADSMRARGYGTGKRTAFSIFNFDERDKAALVMILFLGMCTLVGVVTGRMSFSFFPIVKSGGVSYGAVGGFLAYALLCIFPTVSELMEVMKWNALKRKN